MKGPAGRRPRLLLVRDSFPYYGGSSTVLYLLFEILRRDLSDCEYWNLVSPRLARLGPRHYGPSWPNPRGLPDVRTFRIEADGEARELGKALRAHPRTIVLSKSRRATRLVKTVCPPATVWHLTSTCGAVKEAVATGRLQSRQQAMVRLHRGQRSELVSEEEGEAVRLADRILLHSEDMRYWLSRLYPGSIPKTERTIFWDYPLLKRGLAPQAGGALPWRRRPIDLLFVASDWGRPEKGFPLVRALCAAFPGRRIMVVGLLPESLPSSVLALSTLPHADVFEAMGQAKVVACPSLYDEAPNVLFEAALAGANVVCSRNCGNFRIAAPELVAPLSVQGFADRIRLALRAPCPARTDAFDRADLSEWILEGLHPPAR